MITFEHPLSERVRNFLRIEYLFKRFQDEIVCSDSVWAHHLALATLFDIMECAARAELKLDILQELERQKQMMVQNRDRQSACLYLEGPARLMCRLIIIGSSGLLRNVRLICRIGFVL